MADVKTFKKGIKLDPQSADPTGTQGQVQFSDGTVRSEGLWQYKGGAWSPIGGGAGSSDTLHLIKAASDSDTDFTIKSIDDLLPDFEATDTLTATFNVPTSGNDALLSDDDAHKVYKFATTTASQYDAVGRSFTIPKGYRGRDILCEFQYRTEDTSGDSVDADYMTWIYDETNGIKLTASANEAIGQTVLSINEDATALETDTFVDGDVSVANDELTLTAHTLKTGDLVQLTTTGTLPAGLALSTDYYVINLDANTIGLATSYANALAGTEVDITAAAGGGTHTISKRLPVGTKIWISCDSDVLETHVTAISSSTITVADALVSQWSSGKPAFTGILTDVLTTLNAADSDIAKKGTSFKKYVLVPETCESIAFVIQQLTSETDSFLYFDNILISGDPFKKVETQGQAETFRAGPQAFWAAATDTYEFNESLLTGIGGSPVNFSDSRLLKVVNNASKDYIEAKQDIVLDIAFGGVQDAASTIYLYDQDDAVIANMDQATSAYNASIAVSVKLRKGQSVYCRNNNPYSNQYGWMVLTATPEKSTSIIVESADSVMSDWTSYTPTFTAFGTPISIACFYRRVGDTLEVQGRFTSGTPTGATAEVSLPAGLIIDSYIGTQIIGSCNIDAVISSSDHYTLLADGGGTTFKFGDQSTNTAINANTGTQLVVASQIVAFRGAVKIAGWTGVNKPLLALPTVTVGQDAEQAFYYGRGDADGRASTNTAIMYYASTGYDSVSNLGTVSNSATNGWSFTATKRCKVNMSVNCATSSAAWFGISKNTTGLTTAVTAIGAGEAVTACYNDTATGADSVTWSGILEPGDILRPHLDTVSTCVGTSSHEMSCSLLVEPEIGQQNMAAILSSPVCYVKDVKTAGSQGGSGSAASWTQVRTLNTLSGDIAEVGVSLSSNQFTLPSGKYDIEWRAPAGRVNKMQSKLYNVTDSVNVEMGSSHYCDATNYSHQTSHGYTTVTITKATAFEIRQYTQIATGTDDLGDRANAGENEVYTQVKITRKK